MNQSPKTFTHTSPHGENRTQPRANEAPGRPHPGHPSVREENLQKRVQQGMPISNSTGASTPAPFGLAPQRAPTSPWPLRAT